LDENLSFINLILYLYVQKQGVQLRQNLSFKNGWWASKGWG